MGDPASVAPGVTDAGATLDGHEPDLCFAVTVTRNCTDWTVNSLISCFTRTDDTIDAAQRLGPEKPTFSLLCVNDDSFIIVPPTPAPPVAGVSGTYQPPLPFYTSPHPHA